MPSMPSPAASDTISDAAAAASATPERAVDTTITFQQATAADAPLSPTTPALGVSQQELVARKQRVASRQLRISCVAPAMNEAGQVAEFIAQLDTYLAGLSDVYEIVLVDDGSTDATLELAREALQGAGGSGQLVSLSRNFGKEAGIAAGLQAARGEVVVVMDADFQHPFASLDDFIAQWQLGYDHVYAVKSGAAHEAWPWRLGRRLFHGLMKAGARVQLPYGASDFRLLGRKVVDALNGCTEQDKFMKGLYAFVGFRTAAVPYKVLPRRHGQSRYHALRLTRFALSGFLSFSSLPLRVWSVVGLVIAAGSFLSAAWIVIDTLLFGIKVPGYATLLVTVVFFGGVQVLSIGVLGEYIARIFREVKPRPAFIVQQTTELGAPWQQ